MSNKIIINLNPKLASEEVLNKKTDTQNFSPNFSLVDTQDFAIKSNPIFDADTIFDLNNSQEQRIKQEFTEFETKFEPKKEIKPEFLGSPAFGSILDYFPAIDQRPTIEPKEVEKKTEKEPKAEVIDSYFHFEKPEIDLEAKTPKTNLEPKIAPKKPEKKPENIEFVDSEISENYLKPSKFRVIIRVLVSSMLICSVLTFGVALTGTLNNFENSETSQPAVAGVMSSDPEMEGFRIWLKKYNIDDLVKNGDTDSDGLTNWEEYKLGTNPIDKKTCGDKTDGQNLLELIDPKTCKEIDLENEEEIQRFAEFINTAETKQAILPEIKVSDKPSNLKELFGNDYEKLDKLAQNPSKYNEGFEEKLEAQKKKLILIGKINKFIQSNRSFEPKDRDYDIPVLGSQYLEISEQSKVPLKYFLAIAKLESRFGTDKFDSNGNQTRPFRFKNIFSMGLDDSGGNIGFASWEDGVKSFGKWYNRLAKVSDCAKWKIYNPNIDANGLNYCQKVEKTASEIEDFLR